jgi:hypothetical protein
MGVIFKRQLIAEVVEDLAPPPDREAVREAAEFGADRRGWVLLTVYLGSSVLVVVGMTFAGLGMLHWIDPLLRTGIKMLAMMALMYYPVSGIIAIPRRLLVRWLISRAIRAETRIGS